MPAPEDFSPTICWMGMRAPGPEAESVWLWLQAAPRKVIVALQRAFGGLRDDTSLIVLDLVAPGLTFSQAVQQLPKRQPSSAGACFCFAPCVPPPPPPRSRITQKVQ